jgi:transcriptional regulator with XRE-family HTH domain
MKDKHSLGNVLTSLMTECEIDDIFLSKQTGIPVSTLSRLRTNADSNPTAHTLRPIAKFFDISIGQLLGDEPLPLDRIPGTHVPTPFVTTKIPVLKWDWIDDWKNGTIEKYKPDMTHWVSTERNVSEKAFALTVQTDSLGLPFRKGSLLIIESEKIPNDGDLILIKMSSSEPIVLKQIVRDGNDIYVKSVNPELKGIKLISNDASFYGVLIETRYSLVEKENQNNSFNTAHETDNISFMSKLLLSRK